MLALSTAWKMQLSFTMWAYRSALPIHVHYAGVATETFAYASDTSQSTYGIEHIEVKDMHLYILCRCEVLPKTRLMDIAVSKKGYYGSI